MTFNSVIENHQKSIQPHPEIAKNYYKLSFGTRDRFVIRFLFPFSMERLRQIAGQQLSVRDTVFMLDYKAESFPFFRAVPLKALICPLARLIVLLELGNGSPRPFAYILLRPKVTLKHYAPLSDRELCKRISTVTALLDTSLTSGPSCLSTQFSLIDLHSGSFKP